MDWELFELGIEALKAVVLLFITCFLIWTGRDWNWGQKGWKCILLGFSLLAFAALLDLSDEFAGLEQYLIIGDTEIQSFLEKVIGYSGGYLILLSGLLHWIPTQKQVTGNLQRKVNERTAELQKMQQFTAAVVEQSHDLIIACDTEGYITLSNSYKEDDLTEETIGLSLKEWCDRYPQYAIDGAAPLPLQELPLYRALQGEVIKQEEIVFNGQILLTRGCPIYDETGKQQGAMISAFDITEQKQLETQLSHQAHYDSLTGMPNRFLFNERLNQTSLRIQRNGGQVAVMMLDLDRFKEVNDSLGHAVGDLLLKQVPLRLKEHLRECDTIARLGGDEFAILLELTAENAAYHPLQVAERLLDQLSLPFCLNEQEVRIGASIGITYCPEDGKDTHTLLRNADAAMYQAKAAGRNGFYCYHTELNQQALSQLKLKNAMAQALERDQFAVYYQPLIQASNGRIVGVEALLRWHHPEKGLIPAADFIPLAESTGLIVPLGEWVMRTACNQLKSWQQKGFPLLRVAVNLSERQLHHPELVENIAITLQETKLPTGSLILELTESMLIQDSDSMLSLLEQLRQLGVQLAIDDFGTGYSSLSYLRQFPVSQLKLDRSFVNDIPHDTVISKAIIELAHQLNIKVVAEGVETETQLSFLKKHGCDELQGFLFSKPVPADELEKLLRSKLLTQTATKTIGTFIHQGKSNLNPGR